MSPVPSRFTVQLVGHVRADLERLATRAEELDLRGLYRDVLCQLEENLQIRPREWGDPYTNFRGLHAVRYGKTIMPAVLRVEYTVHDTEPLVWVSSVRPLPGSPFV